MSEDEVTPGGSQVYRHQERTVPFQPAHSAEHLEAISAHIEAHVGPEAGVFHELVSDLVHVDVHVVAPSPQRPCTTLVTSGMSEAPMRVETEAGVELAWAELTLSLPPEWPLEPTAFEDERNYWPIRLLKELARLPHAYDTWLGFGHSIPNGDPAEPYAATTGFCCALLLRPVSLPEEFFTLELSPAKQIEFWGVYPLYAEEVAVKLERGTEAVIELFQAGQVSDVIDVGRPNLGR